MLVAFALALASQQVGEHVLEYRPKPGMTSVYWFTATLEQTEGPPHEWFGDVSFAASSVEIRTVTEQDDFETTVRVLTYWKGLPGILNRTLFMRNIEPAGGPIESTVVVGARGQIIPNSLYEELLNPDFPASISYLFAMNQMSVLGPFPIEPFDSEVRWSLDARDLSPLIGLFSSFSPEEEFVIHCSASIVKGRDELRVMIGLPLQGLGDSELSGGGEAVIRLSTGEIESLEMTFEQRVGNVNRPAMTFRYRYTVQRVAEFGTPDDDG